MYWINACFYVSSQVWKLILDNNRPPAVQKYRYFNLISRNQNNIVPWALAELYSTVPPDVPCVAAVPSIHPVIYKAPVLDVVINWKNERQ